MIPVAIQEIHARGTQFLEISIYLGRIGGWVNYRQKAGIKKTSIAMVAQARNSIQDLGVGSLAGVVDSMAIMNSLWTVDANSQTGAKFGADIEKCFGDQRAVGLDTEGVFCWQHIA